MKLFTIGVYNSSEETFFKKLIDNKIDTFVDIRQRRGVRGSKYSFINSKKLQKKLSDLNIKYIHKIDLAPSSEIRNLQKKADLLNNDIKKNREQLDVSFIHAFENIVLNKFDAKLFINNLKTDCCSNVVMFCVEENAKACHRSIVAKKIAEEFNLIVYDL